MYPQLTFAQLLYLLFFPWRSMMTISLFLSVNAQKDISTKYLDIRQIFDIRQIHSLLSRLLSLQKIGVTHHQEN